MEYAIGAVELQYNGMFRIRALAYLDQGKWRYTGTYEAFPPDGKVFAPNLGYDNSQIKDGDVIMFNYIPNPRQTGRDEIILAANRDGGEFWKCPRIMELDLRDVRNHVQVSPNAEDLYFFLREPGRTCICGPVTNRLTPRTGKEVNAWKPREQDVVTDPSGGQAYLAVNPLALERRPPDSQVDCMTPKQLADWLKGKLDLKSLQVPQPVFSKFLADVAAVCGQEAAGLDRQRYRRVSEGLGQLELAREELRKFCAFPEVREEIEAQSGERYAAYLAERQKEVDARNRQFEEEKQKIERRIQELREDLSRRKDDFDSEFERRKREKEGQLEKIQKDFASLVENKEEIIRTIRLRSGNAPAPAGSPEAGFSYPLERIPLREGAARVTDGNEALFCARADECLRRRDGFMRTALERLRTGRPLRTGDIRTGICLAAALGNSLYVLCQPSPKWIEFKDFWNEALAPAWNSAQAEPDAWHFLLVENFNLALPECWGMPLWNLLDGKTTLLPLAEKPSLPPNLRIVVSAAAAESDDGSHLGLRTRIADAWPGIDVAPEDDWNLGDGWRGFVEDRAEGLAVNAEYYFPVGR